MGKVTLFLLCCFVAFLPFEMMAYFEDLPSGSKLLGMLIVGTGLLAFLTGYPIRLLSWPMVMRVVLVLYGCMSLGWSVAPQCHVLGDSASGSLADLRIDRLGVCGHL